MEEHQDIDWHKALQQVGGDEGFLIELLPDLLTELEEHVQSLSMAFHLVEDGICSGDLASNIETCQAASHAIKGSCLTLACNQLTKTATSLNDEIGVLQRGGILDNTVKQRLKPLVGDILAAFKSFEKMVETIQSGGGHP